jgi:hypothetical protein
MPDVVYYVSNDTYTIETVLLSIEYGHEPVGPEFQRPHDGLTLFWFWQDGERVCFEYVPELGNIWVESDRPG